MDWMAERMDFSLLHSVIEGVPLSPEELLSAAEDTLKLLPTIPELPRGSPSETPEPAASSDQVAPHTPPPSPPLPASTDDPCQLIASDLTSLTTVVCQLSDLTSLTTETCHLLDLGCARAAGGHFGDWGLSVIGGPQGAVGITGGPEEPVGALGEPAGAQDHPSFPPVAADTRPESVAERETDCGLGQSEPGSRGRGRGGGRGWTRPVSCGEAGAGARCTPLPGSRKRRKMEQNKTAAFRYRRRKRAEQQDLEQECRDLEQRNKALSDKEASLLTDIHILQNILGDIGKAKP